MELVTFTLAGCRLALEAPRVCEVGRLQGLVVPREAVGCLLGAVNLRGTIVPVLDLRRRLCGEASLDPGRGRLVVVEVAALGPGGLLGLAVDDVGAVAHCDGGDFVPGAVRGDEPGGPAWYRGLCALRDEALPLLDSERLLQAGETAAIARLRAAY